MPWHAGVHLPLPTLLAVAGGEYLVHGHDIARATRVPWPVPADWARTVFLGVLPASVQTATCPLTRGHSCVCSTAAAGPSGQP